MSTPHRSVWTMLGLGGALVVLALGLLYGLQPRPPRPEIWVARGSALLAQWCAFLAILSSASPRTTSRVLSVPFRTAHYTFSVAALILMLVHPLAVALVLGRLDVFVPSLTSWRGFLMEGGRAALYLFALASILALSRFRRRLRRLWRFTHLLTYVAFLLVTVHALLIGRTHHHAALRAVSVVLCVVATIVLVRNRFRLRRRASG